MPYRQRTALDRLLFCLALIAAASHPREAARELGRRLIAKRTKPAA
jgi:hypothetical protein